MRIHDTSALERYGDRVVNDYWARRAFEREQNLIAQRARAKEILNESNPINKDADKPDKNSVQKSILIGVDVGLAVDPSALVVVSLENRDQQKHYFVRKMIKFPLQTPYKSVAGRCGDISRKLAEQGHNQRWLFDVGGSRPFMSLVEDENIINATPVQIIGSGKTRIAHGAFHVLKADMVSSLQVASNPEAPRIHINKNSQFATDLIDELRQYEARESPATGHVSYGAMSSGSHDDLVSALGYCVAFGERPTRKGPRIRWL